MNDKKLMNFTIDKSIIEEFNKVAKSMAINKSQLIENFISKWILENTDDNLQSNE
jgi:antitoxin component of RelBE/YafQ-DinJ toxin-antitoxin module